jgi:hypothetical protein
MFPCHATKLLALQSYKELRKTTANVQFKAVVDSFFGLNPASKPQSATHLSLVSNLQNSIITEYTI